MSFVYQPKWLQEVPSTSYVVEESRLRHNLEILKGVQDRTGCSILLAQKAFSMFHFYPLISKYLKGTTACGIYEAKLAHEEFPGENHVFSPAKNSMSNHIDQSADSNTLTTSGASFAATNIIS